MQPIVASLAALAVALVYYMWRDYNQERLQRRQRILRRRVAHLLWVMAEQIKENDSGLSAT